MVCYVFVMQQYPFFKVEFSKNGVHRFFTGVVGKVRFKVCDGCGKFIDGQFHIFVSDRQRFFANDIRWRPGIFPELFITQQKFFEFGQLFNRGNQGKFYLFDGYIKEGRYMLSHLLAIHLAPFPGAICRQRSYLRHKFRFDKVEFFGIHNNRLVHNVKQKSIPDYWNASF